MPRATSLPAYLADMQREIEGYAQDYGLDFFDTIFEVLDYKRMNEVAAYGGFPTRYPHWRFGMDFEQPGQELRVRPVEDLRDGDQQQPVPTPTCSRATRSVDQKMVMAHVLRRTSTSSRTTTSSRKTNRRMIDGMANHATRVRRHIERLGHREGRELHRRLPVAREPDRSACRRSSRATARPSASEERRRADGDARRCRSCAPRATWTSSSTRPSSSRSSGKKMERRARRSRRSIPRASRSATCCCSCSQHAPLERWERDVLEIVRDEAYYFAPQAHDQDHERGLGHLLALEDHDREGADGRRDHRLRRPQRRACWRRRPGSSTRTSSASSCYRHIEERWNKGQLRQGVGRVRATGRARSTGTGASASGARRSSRCASSTTTSPSSTSSSPPSSAASNKFFSFGFNERTRQLGDRLARVQEGEGQAALPADQLRRSRSSSSRTATSRTAASCCSRHQHEGIDLKMDHARDTLEAMTRVWKRPVNLLTRVDGKGKILRFDGRDHSEKGADYPDK